jgi:tRNA (Thr-GGU) A37 N-methylase
VGTFALRTPNRPNPIGVSIVQLLERHDNVLRVVGLDAVDGSPLLDLKAYSPRHDAVSDPVIPEWAEQLW